MQPLIATTNITTGWKWLAILIGLGALAAVWLLVGLTNRTIGWRIWRLTEGEDKVPSTSKLQWLIWLTVVLFSYTALWVLRAKAGHYGAITNVPANVLAVLGFSTATAATAKGITVGYLHSGRIVKRNPAPAQSAQTQPTQNPPAVRGGILQDDSGFPELAKIQMIAFTLLAVGIFLTTVFHEIRAHPGQAGLPNIDSSLLVLMGISQGGYLGKKLVSIRPRQEPPYPSTPMPSSSDPASTVR